MPIRRLKRLLEYDFLLKNWYYFGGFSVKILNYKCKSLLCYILIISGTFVYISSIDFKYFGPRRKC